MREVVIVAAARTAIGKFGGSLMGIPAWKLGSIAIAEALSRAGLDPNIVDEVIMGNVLQSGQGQGPARQAAVNAGLPHSVAAMTINRICGSGLEAVNTGAAKIIAGEVDAVVAGGMENMSDAPFLLDSARWGYRMGHGKLVDSMLSEALTDAFDGLHMGVTAENLAERYGISRGEQDEFAAASQEKAETALKNGVFQKEITPVEVVLGKKETRKFIVDEYPRAGITAASLSSLKPAFKENGTVTAGNSSGINDGAAVLILMEKKAAKERGIPILAKFVVGASAGVDPRFMGIGPVFSTRKVLSRSRIDLKDIGLIEANEAFAAQSLAVGKELGWDPARVNVNGGAIALGHPVGASGSRILVTLLYEMLRREVRFGLATLCVGGGMGVSTIIERA
ncbi:MAG: acetyl-CoA C-acetyltransferase [Treponemataceae bacterium]